MVQDLAGENVRVKGRKHGGIALNLFSFSFSFRCGNCHSTESTMGYTSVLALLMDGSEMMGVSL